MRCMTALERAACAASAWLRKRGWRRTVWLCSPGCIRSSPHSLTARPNMVVDSSAPPQKPKGRCPLTPLAPSGPWPPLPSSVAAVCPHLGVAGLLAIQGGAKGVPGGGALELAGGSVAGDLQGG